MTDDLKARIGDVWYCKVGFASNLPPAADSPMRNAVGQAFCDMLGEWPEFTFSGWGQELTEAELAVVENRLPDPAKSNELVPRAELDEARAEITRLRDDAQFLCDRLDEQEWHDGQLEEGVNNFMGHVDPAHDRLKQTLAKLSESRS